LQVILHIGTGKTGTTTIQNVLARRREALRARGILYPQSLGRANHEAAAVCAADFEPGFTPKKAPSVRDEAALPAFRDRMREALAGEIRQSGCATVVISNEHLFEKVREPRHAQRVLDLLGTGPEAVTIVLYVRPQVDMAAAVYGELLRMGSAPDYDRFFEARRTRALLDYRGGVEAWAAVFGMEAIRLRVFDRKRLAGGDVLTDFAGVAGIDPEAVAPGPDIAGFAESRRSFDAATVAFMERFNAAVTEQLTGPESAELFAMFRSVPHRKRIVGCIERLGHAGPRFAIDPVRAKALRERYRDDNRWLFEQCGVEPFGDGAEGAGAESADPVDLDYFFRLFASLWIEATLSASDPEAGPAF
jgi:hypothetical protein